MKNYKIKKKYVGCIISKRPVLHQDVSGQQRHVLHLDAATPQRLEVYQCVLLLEVPTLQELELKVWAYISILTNVCCSL
jgi:hypothetical protein